MKTWYLNRRSNMLIDTENGSATHVDSEYTSIDSCYIAPEDCDMTFTDKKGNVTKYKIKKGQMVVTFYSEDMPNPMIIIDDPKFVENIIAYKEARQKEKEEWAAEKCSECTNCIG